MAIRWLHPHLAKARTRKTASLGRNARDNLDGLLIYDQTGKQRFRARAACYKLAKRAGALMGLWTGSRPANEAMNRVAAEIYALIEGG